MAVRTVRLQAPPGSAGSAIKIDALSLTVGADGTITVDSKYVADLLKAGFSLYGQTTGNRVTVSGAQQTAGTMVIDTGLSKIDSYNVMITRAGKVTSGLAAVSDSGGVITVATNGANYVLTSGDVVLWLALGTTV